jgi:hypothetical protein
MNPRTIELGKFIAPAFRQSFQCLFKLVLPGFQFHVCSALWGRLHGSNCHTARGWVPLYPAQTQSGPPPMKEDRNGWLYKWMDLGTQRGTKGDQGRYVRGRIGKRHRVVCCKARGCRRPGCVSGRCTGVDADPLAQIIGLVDSRVGGLGKKRLVSIQWAQSYPNGNRGLVSGESLDPFTRRLSYRE